MNKRLQLNTVVSVLIRYQLSTYFGDMGTIWERAKTLSPDKPQRALLSDFRMRIKRTV
jgi:hypothetical protein